MWTGTFSADEGNPDIGSAFLTWTSKDETLVFVFTARVKIGEKDQGGSDVIAKEAMVSRDAWLARKVNSDAGTAALLEKLNAADAQAG